MLARMAMETSTILRVLGTSLSATHGACNIIRRILTSGELGVVEKGRNDLQTEADRSAQRSIVGRLQHRFPALTVIGEEDLSPEAADLRDADDDPKAAELEAEVLGMQCPTELRDTALEDMVVWVDPLDGTNEFTQGLLDHVTVLVGLAVKGRPVAGVVAQPYYNYQDKGAPLGRIVWGMQGLGVHNLTPKAPPDSSLVVTTTRSHGTGIVDKAINAMAPTEVLRVGGSGHKVLLLLEGKAHAYVFASKGTKKWDTCAPEAILEVCGGRMTDLLGRELPYGKGAVHLNAEGLFATAKAADHATLMAKLPEEVREHFSPK